VNLRFLTTIAHELRTPLTSAAGFLQVISLGMMDGETLKSALATVTRNIEQIVSLTNDILFLQEMDLILAEFEPVDIGAIITAIVNEEREHAEKAGVGLQLNIAPNLPNVLGDAKTLKRAFAAFLNNAIKFSPGGDVEVSVEHNDTHLWVAVRDTGVGIPEDVLPKVFDRFFRIEEFDGHMFGGVGLGLSIARQVIEQQKSSWEGECFHNSVEDNMKFSW
jgi:signal transduction histidine kinase